MVVGAHTAVMSSPFSLNVQPAGTCASQSFATPDQPTAGNSLELATAGLQSQFTVTVGTPIQPNAHRYQPSH